MSFTFQNAVREQLKARVAIDGPSGAGKTWDMLVALTALAGPNGRIAVIDTERGSARLYADFFKFDVLELPTDHRMYSPAVYVEAIKAAEAAGYDAIGIDSLSHAWEGEGGALSLVDQAAAKNKGNSYVAWRNVTPLQTKLVDTMLQCKAHIVITMRSKMDYEQVEENGRKVVRKVGMAPIQRAGMEYEFTMVCDVDVDHRLIVSKSRCAQLADRQVVKPDVKFFQELADWLAGGAPATEKPVIAPEPEQQKAPVTEPSAIKSTWTLANLIKEAGKRYGVTEEEVRTALRENGVARFKPEDYPGVLGLLDKVFFDKKKVEPETEPEFLQQPKEVEA